MYVIDMWQINWDYQLNKVFIIMLWLLNFALSKALEGKVKVVNN